MPDCHTCPHNGKGHKACKRCPGPSAQQHKGARTISLDALSEVDDQSLGMTLAVLRDHPKGPPTPDADADRVQYARFVHALFTLDDKTWRIIRHRYLNPRKPLSAIAKKYGLSTQAVHQRLQHLAETFPAVRDLVGLKLKRK